jgi:hypothetical protein
MYIRTHRLITAFAIFTIALTSVSSVFARFDEGMYAPGQIASLPLKAKGLKIKPEEIYNPAGGGLTDAVIRLSIGCSAEFVSPQGLILTNHHCALDALVSASTPGNDLVENGFRTDSRAGEIPAKGYSIFITERVEDVTDKIKAGTANLSGDALAAAIKKNTDDLLAAEQAKAPAGSTVRIQMLNSGFFYYLYQTRQIKDIRVVYAPPRNIGVFGGDPDNFEWTRHTGDFTFLRAYTAPDGSPAEYSVNNVPYRPKKWLTTSIAGVKDGDFVFVLGYPGSTTRYRESWSMKYARDANFPFLERWLDALSTSLRKIGENDEEKRIALQSDIASFDNSRKAFGGGALRLKRSKVVEMREAEEAKLAAWIAANPARQQKYGTLLSELKTLSEETNATQMRDVIIRRFPDPNSMTVLGQVFQGISAGQVLDEEKRAAKLAEIKKAFEDREPGHELEMLKFFFREFDKLPADQKFKPAEDLFGSLKGKARRDAEAEFANSIANGYYASPERLITLYGPQTMDFNPEREKIRDFVRGIIDERNALNARSQKFASQIDRLRLLYMQAMTEMKGTKTVYPDANSTLRFTYGHVKGYESREAEFRSPITTMKGMFEKETGVNPWDVPAKLHQLHNARDFGPYGSGDTVVVNFISTTDIIGGNSGSPILNAHGQLVGVCFDGNFEGLGNDFYYDPDKNRTISVDIRYVLFITEKFGNAKWVVDEMTIVGGKR